MTTIEVLMGIIIVLLTLILGTIICGYYRWGIIELNGGKSGKFRKGKIDLLIAIPVTILALMFVLIVVFTLYSQPQDLLAITSLLVAYFVFIFSIWTNPDNTTQLNRIDNRLDQIDTRLDRIETHQNDRFPPQPPYDDETADRKKVRTTKEYIRASFSGRCHK